VAHRGWKLKHAPIPRLDTVLLESPGFCDIHAGFFLGTNDVGHPDPQRCFFVWACRLVTAGKDFNNGFCRATHVRLFSAGFFLDFNASDGILLSGLLQASDPIPQGLQIVIVYRQSPNVLIKLDRMLEALFRLFHAARDARVAGKAESDHGNFGMYRLRPQQNGFRLLYTLDPPDRIGETDPPDLVFRLTRWLATAAAMSHFLAAM
jgi:hypothetical protein